MVTFNKAWKHTWPKAFLSWRDVWRLVVLVHYISSSHACSGGWYIPTVPEPPPISCPLVRTDRLIGGSDYQSIFVLSQKWQQSLENGRMIFSFWMLFSRWCVTSSWCIGSPIQVISIKKCMLPSVWSWLLFPFVSTFSSRHLSWNNSVKCANFTSILTYLI